jgi:serine/threonine-protein kinase
MNRKKNINMSYNNGIQSKSKRKGALPVFIALAIIFILSSCTGNQPDEVIQATATFITLNTAAPTAVVPTVTSIPPTPTVTAVPELTIGSTRVSEIDGMEQVFVPAGDFLMGTNDIEAKRSEEGGRAYPEVPQHTVYLDSYWIDKYEVTNSQYALCLAAGVCTEPHRINSFSYTDYFIDPTYANYPVVWLSWFQARDYCTWAGRRLPTEAEWEKAARGTDGRKYPWGNEELTGERANFCDVNCTRTIANPLWDDGYADTAPVGNYPAGISPYGALDMSGNVWEWTSTLPFPYPYDATDGREDPNVIGERVWRSSPFSNGFWWMRSSIRYRALDYYSWYVLGVRCAADPE